MLRVVPLLSSEVIFINGRFVDDRKDATVSIFDRGYLLGDGVFATMRGYDGACFRPDAHLDEISRGAAMLGIHVPYSRADMARWADEAARRTGAATAYVRVTLTSGVDGDESSPTLSIIARPMNDVPGERDYEDGIAAITVAPRRIPPACIDGSIKTTSYAVQVIARREVAVRRAKEGVQLAIDGSLAGGTMSTLFVIMRSTLFTPSLDTGCRNGVTRAAIIHDIAPKLGLLVREERIAPSVLEQADEAFFASTRVECLPIATLDGRPVGSSSITNAARFTRSRAIRAAFIDLVRDETKARRAND